MKLDGLLAWFSLFLLFGALLLMNDARILEDEIFNNGILLDCFLRFNDYFRVFIDDEIYYDIKYGIA